MEVRLVYLEDCPHWRLAEARLTDALAEMGRDPSALIRQAVTTTEEAEACGFGGSPTILIDGRDPFARREDPVGLCCRLYPGDTGPSGAPTVAALRTALADSRAGGAA